MARTEEQVAAVAAMVEHDTRVRERMAERLRDQRTLSVREAKRILTVWQFYLRVLVRFDDRRAVVEQACHLVVLAEIIARWPAAQRGLLGRVPAGHGLEVLAGAAEDDWGWARAVRELGLHAAEHRGCVGGVRELLRRYDGDGIAALAARLT
ncbi:hypothetical protein [Actinophytocola xinjiangensis]|uniref:hypothetical protein n=1 Tax=Actinophytocola xinjiangensis TaxID=485602 RepID=UPI0012B87AE4|nr:hypothetical protein [Actinophytocola xinjiangensis]